MLPDGRVIVEGGEYNSCVPVWSNLGAIYDPLANSWTSVSPPSGWQTIGDAQGVVLADGTYMLANCCTTETALFNAKKLTWTPTGAGKFDLNDEEGWTLLPNGSVLTVDAYVRSYDVNGTNSEIYDPASGRLEQRGQHDRATLGFVSQRHQGLVRGRARGAAAGRHGLRDRRDRTRLGTHLDL